MGMIFWWMLILWLIAGVGYWLGRRYWLKQRGEGHDDAVPIAHSDRLVELPEYKKALKEYQVLLYGAVGAMSLALISTVLLSARPASITPIVPAAQSRDIMLCLDVSGSVLRADTELVNRFTTLTSQFAGQNFGLTVFNSSSIAILPLNDDYEFIGERLGEVGEALRVQKGQAFTDLTSGTLAAFDKGTSLTSDGIASCINNMGENPRDRSQSIILATDNEANGTPIISLAQAVGLAQKRNIRIYAIDPGVVDNTRKADHVKLKDIAEQTGGSYHVLSDTNAVQAIIDDISKQEAKYTESIATVAMSDSPHILTHVVLAATIASLLVAWRLRL